ncbi:hybrid sensor histidine kinase/response regulator, partial [Paraburkholderia madseniana]
EVTLQLPIVCEKAAEAPITARRAMTPMRILLVDDNADATEALRTLLELNGHEVKRAQSGPDALRIVEG